MGVKECNIDRLIRPYREAGAENSKVERTLETISTGLLFKHKIPAHIAGAAIYKVFYKMAFEDLKFEGDGTYGSKGRELFSCIKAQAVDMVQNESAEAVIYEISMMSACTEKDCLRRTEVFPSPKKWSRFKRWMLRSRGWWGV